MMDDEALVDIGVMLDDGWSGDSERVMIDDCWGDCRKCMEQ